MKITITSDDRFLRLRVAPGLENAVVAILPDGAKLVSDVVSKDSRLRIWYHVEMASEAVIPGVFTDQALLIPYTRPRLHGWLAGWCVTADPIFVPPPPSIPTKALIGMHNLQNNNNGLINLLSSNIPMILIMDDVSLCYQAKAAGVKVGMFRWWFQAPPTAQAMAEKLAGLPDGCIGLGVNESEGIDGGTPKGILDHAQWDVAVATLLKKLNPKVFYAGGSFSTGCPDFTRKDICEAVRIGYADSYNSGLLWWDEHLYSPDELWLFKKVGGGPSLANGFYKHEMKVGHDLHTTYYVDDNSTDAIFEGGGPDTFGDEKDLDFQSWFETRWHFVFTRCGFDPRVKHVVSSEMGIDKGGKGGFVGCGLTVDQVLAYFDEWVKRESESWMCKGILVESQMVGGCAFQYPDSENGSGHWGGYCMRLFLQAIAQRFWSKV